MCNKSPAKILRSVKRMTKFIEKKHRTVLSYISLPQVDIPPSSKILSLSQPRIISISPSPKILSFSTPVTADVAPCKIELSPELVKMVEDIQTELNEARIGYNEMVELKNEHIKVLQTQLENLPSMILSQLRPP